MLLFMLFACPPPVGPQPSGIGTGGEFPGLSPGRGRVRFVSGAALAAGEPWEQAVFAEIVGDEPGDFLGEAVAAVGDVDGDGLEETVLTVRDRAHLLPGSAASSLVPLANHWSRPVGRAGDVTGDGVPDVVVDLGGPGTQIWSGADLLGPSPSSVWFTWGPSGDSFTLEPAGDLDGDGVSDLLMNHHVGSGVAVKSALLGPIVSDIVADAVETVPLRDGPSGLRAVGDLDADGRTDLAAIDPVDDGALLVYFGAELASGPARVVLPADARPAAVLFAPGSDLDDDGADELWVLVDDEERRVVAFSRPELAGGVLTSPDLAIEGWVDLVTLDAHVVTIAAGTSSSSFTLSLFPRPELDGSRLLSDAAHTWTVGVTEGWHLRAAGDLNGDSVTDLVLAEPAALPDR